MKTSRAAFFALGFLVLVIVSAAAFGSGIFRRDWRSLLDRPATSPSAAVVRQSTDRQPALPRRGEIALARAQSLVMAGRLRDALAVLDQIAPTDAQRWDADRMRADIQKQLIDLAAIPTRPSPGASTAP
jgi:hypothetical protein